jgi:triosephosphate isomerase
MLADAGADYVIIGHSERRENHLENSAIVKEKAIAAIEANLTPIICVGETLQQRESGEAVIKVNAQLQSSLPQNSNVVIAYEPIWAIGTGLIPTLSEISEIHESIRGLLNKAFGPSGSKISILYGGSVKPDNARKIFGRANVNGALVGGASLKSNDFIPIIEALSDS